MLPLSTSQSQPQACLLATVFAAMICGFAADPLGTTGALPLGAAVPQPIEGTENPSLPAVTTNPALAAARLAASESAAAEASLKQTQVLLSSNNVATAPSVPGIGGMPTVGSNLESLESIAVGANADAMRVPAVPHLDFGNQPQAATPNLLGRDLEDQSMYRSPIMRREAALATAATDPRRLLMTDSASHQDMNTFEEGRSRSFQGDPRFTPEAIFADKHLAPEVAEFLGHLAQRSRVRHKLASRAAAQEAALAQGRTAVAAPGDEEDETSDDIEDMKRSAQSKPKTTALSHFFDAIDSKASSASWLATECATISKNISDKYARMGGRSRTTWGTAGPAGNGGRQEVHTGMFFRHWGLGVTSEATRKLRLGVLSFLATQDPAKVKLHIWTDLDKRNHTLKDILGPIANHPELMDAINITTFDPKVEFPKIPPTLAQITLAERFKKDTMPHLRPDLYRSVILYNYGGMWMDADTVLMQDVVPLLGEDWAYLVKGKQGAVEGALLSASKPRSHFATEYLINNVMRLEPLDGEVQKPLLVEIYENDPAHTTMHVLPPCFIDGESGAPSDVAVLTSGATPGSSFFGRAVPESYREFFSIGIEDAMNDKDNSTTSVLQDASFAQPSTDTDDDDEKKAPTSPSWAYHWRSNFFAPWARGSLADVAERTFMKRLNIRYMKQTHFAPSHDAKQKHY